MARLQFLAESAHGDSTLEEAVTVANRFLSLPEVIACTNDLAALQDFSTHMDTVDILWSQSDSQLYGWIDQREQSAKTIYLNEIFKQRLHLLPQNSEENPRIQFLLVATILHQLAHIIIGWTGHKRSPDGFQGEAGCWFENMVFGGVLAPQIQKGAGKSSSKWTMTMPISGVAIRTFQQGLRRVPDKTIVNLLSARKNFFSLFPLGFEDYRRRKGQFVCFGVLHEHRIPALEVLPPPGTFVLFDWCGT
uniref:Uncharacterized protein n=1 Tax=Spongospora subterranea TaxID=70186 RepID=A0A0H5RG45_9EUKA|eukprot:CRZ12527.1 hypothetical protein [Spongospora subterranea]